MSTTRSTALSISKAEIDTALEIHRGEVGETYASDQAAHDDNGEEEDEREGDDEEDEQDEQDEDEEEQDQQMAEHSDEEAAAVYATRQNAGAVAPATRKGRGRSNPKSARSTQLGITTFPLARVTRLLKADENMEHVSREATFLITIAAELFLKTVTERAYTTGRLERRRYISYSDVQNIVAKDPHWSYLRDVVPDRINYGDALAHRENLARQKSNAAADFFGVPPTPGLERNPPYGELPPFDMPGPPHPGPYPDEFAPGVASGESDVEMKEI